MKLDNNNIKVSIIIPCYKASGKIKKVVDEILTIADDLRNKYKLLIFVVDDCCPDMSWKEISLQDNIHLIHHEINKGVGASFITGLSAAFNFNCDIYIKIDADGQHLPLYLYEIIPYILQLPRNELTLLKGNRFYLHKKNRRMPIIRRLGSILLEPIARLAIGFRGLSDIANGYIAFNSLTARYLFNDTFRPYIEKRYLFESSLIVKSSFLDCNIHEFLMCARYGDKWTSSLNSWHIIFPLFIFFFKSTIKRLKDFYIFKINLGSILLTSSFLSFLFSFYLFIFKIYPLYIIQKSLSAGRITVFTSTLLLAILSSGTFIIYDYYLRKRTKKIKFNATLQDIKLLNNTK